MALNGSVVAQRPGCSPTPDCFLAAYLCVGASVLAVNGFLLATLFRTIAHQGAVYISIFANGCLISLWTLLPLSVHVWIAFEPALHRPESGPVTLLAFLLHSQLFVMLLNWTLGFGVRYTAMVHPRAYRQHVTPRRMAASFGGVWLAGLGIAGLHTVPGSVCWQLNNAVYGVRMGAINPAMLTFFVLCVGLPFLASAFFVGRIWCQTRTAFSAAAATNSAGPDAALTRAMWTLMRTVAVTLVHLCPFLSIYFAISFAAVEVDPALQLACLVWYYLYSVSQTVMVLLTHAPTRDSARQLLRCPRRRVAAVRDPAAK